MVAPKPNIVNYDPQYSQTIIGFCDQAHSFIDQIADSPQESQKMKNAITQLKDSISRKQLP